MSFPSPERSTYRSFFWRTEQRAFFFAWSINCASDAARQHQECLMLAGSAGVRQTCKIHDLKIAIGGTMRNVLPQYLHAELEFSG